MIFYKLMLFCCLFSVSVYPIDGQAIELVAEFNSQQASGTVSFSQTDDSSVEISVDKSLQKSGYKFGVHEFAVKYEGPMSEICNTKNIGDIFNPENCQSNKSNCAIGDLSNRLSFNGGKVKDTNLSLSGQDSIFGRSLAIYNNSKVIACTTIKSNVSATKSLVGVFRAVSPGIAGTIVLRQAADDPNSDSTVNINLMLVDARSEPMTGLSLAVYKTASTSNTEGSCEGVKEIFNPLGKTSCDKRKHGTCPIGNLSAKLGLLDIPLPGNGKSHSLYIDTNLPLSGENSVAGHSLVILSNGQPLICATIQEYQEMVSEVTFSDDQGLSGKIGFTQGSLYEPVVVNVSLSDGSYGISVYEHDSSCDVKKIGNQWKLINTDSGAMDELTMYGSNSIMFRSLVVNKTGSPPKLYCKKIQPKDTTYHLNAQIQFNETSARGLAGFINFKQVLFDKSKAFAYSASILMSVYYMNNQSKITTDHNWHVHISHVGGDSKMAVGKKCMSCQGHYNPYNVYEPNNDYASTCNPSNPYRCELGDLSSKLGTYNIGGGLKQFTETENYLASWHNIIGRSMVFHVENKGAARLACADLLPQDSSVYNMETLNVRNTSKTRDTANFQKVVSEALNIESWRVADAKFEQMKTDKECLTYEFLLIDDSSSDLHQALADLVEDNPDKLKEFVPACEDESGWKINEGKSAEIIGIVFGLVILIILIVCMVLWLRKRSREEEESSKLVQSVDAAAATNETAINIENNDNPPDPKNEYKVTTSL